MIFMPQQRPSPNATFAAHAAVGIAGSAATHALIKPKTDAEKVIAWLVGAAFLIWLHHKLDLPVAKLISAALPALG